MTTVDDGRFALGPFAFPPSSNLSPPADGRLRAYWVWAICGFLLLAVGLVFGQTVGHEFTQFDDQEYVNENPHVAPGLTLDGIWWALTSGPFDEWYPLTMLSHMLDCELYGVKPAGHYLTNVLLHAASSVVLFLVLLRMTGDLWPSAWVAAVFAIHPLHVESVAWLAERRDVLSGLFFMLTLGAYALYAERPSLGRYLAVAGIFALGLMAKPMLVTVPFLLLLLDYWPLDRFRRAEAVCPPAAPGSWLGRLPVGWRLVVEKIPLMALAAASCGMVVATHSTIRSSNPVERLSLATRLANAVVSYATYLGQSFFPARLAPFYPHSGTRLPTALVAGSLILLLAITAAVAYWWRRRPYLPVGWLWFLGMLVPVIGLVQIGGHGRADRYTYLSQIGVAIALAWGACELYRSPQSHQMRLRGWMLAVVSAATVLLLAVVAGRQASFWRNPETLWTHTIASTGDNAVAHHNLGVLYLQQGRNEEAINQLREAAAIDFIDPQLTAMTHSVLGDALTKQGKVDEALQHYEAAVRIYPQGVILHAQLAGALASQNGFDRAIAELREALRLAPGHLLVRLDLATVLLGGGQPGEAAALCREILDEEPNLTRAIVMLGTALADQGKAKEAIPPFKRALELEPSNAQAHFRLGLALWDLGRSQSAVDQLNEAVQLDPGDVSMLWQTAWILATSADSSVRNGSRAVDLAAKAVQLTNNQKPQALDALAAALAETGKFAAAVDAAEHASAIALVRGDDALAGAIDQRKRLYRQSLPYRQPASTPAGKHAPAHADE